MPNEKRARQEACLSSEDERTPPHKHEASAAILESIHEKLKPSVAEKGRPKPMHVAFLRYMDKMKVLRNAAARLKDNPLYGNVIGISEDFAKKKNKSGGKISCPTESF